jgi:transposase
LSFESKKNTNDYHDEMNGNTFLDWMKKVLPLLKDNCVIVMDNAPYHSVKAESCPTSSWNKKDIEKWLEEKGEVYEKPKIKPRLMDIVNSIKPRYNQYLIDEYVKKHNKVILRIPPYHCELNPIELAWSVVKQYVRSNNTTFKLNDVHKLLHEGIQHCTPQMWKNFIHHTQKIEEKFWEIDFFVCDFMDNMGSNIMTITGETSDSYSDSD